jgi:hypothetical protein
LPYALNKQTDSILSTGLKALQKAIKVQEGDARIYHMAAALPGQN